MNDETVFPSEVQDGVPAESAALATEGLDPESTETTAATEPVTEPTETVPETTEYYIPDVTEDWEQLEPVSDPEETTAETVPETTEIVMDDLVELAAESTSILANIILCGALMIVGALCGIRFWR